MNIYDLPPPGMWAIPWWMVVLIAASIAVAAHYYLEHRDCTEADRPMEPLRHPLRLFATAASRLWSNRLLLGLIGVLWLGSFAAQNFVIYPLIEAPKLEEARGPDADGDDTVPMTIRHGPSTENPVVDSLPRTYTVHIDSSGGLCSAGLMALLAMALLYLWARPPDWLSEADRRRLIVPMILVFVGAGVGLWMRIASLSWTPEEPFRSPIPVPLLPVISLAAPFVGAAALAFWLSTIYQVGAGRQWDWREAVRSIGRDWLPVAWFYFVVWAPMTLLAVINAALMQGSPPYTYGHFLSYVIEHLMGGPILFSIALVFVPWLIMGRKDSFRQAFVRNFRMMADRWRDLVILALRWVVVMAPIWAVLDYYSTTGQLDRLTLNTTFMAFQPVRLVLLIAVVVLFLHARSSVKEAESPQTAGVSTGGDTAE